jgi:hypothetical protein
MRGQPIDLCGFVAVVNGQRRALSALGALDRDPKLINGTTTAAPADAHSRFLQEIREAIAATSTLPTTSTEEPT